MARKEFNEVRLRAIDCEKLGFQITFVTCDTDEERQECRDNAKAIRDRLFPLPIPTSGPCLICGKHATIERGDGYGPGVFCCYGPGCIPF